MEINVETDFIEIFDQYEKGLRKPFDILVSTLRNNNSSSSATKISDDLLLLYMKGLHLCVTNLNKEFYQLVQEIMKIDWPYRSNELINEYQSFILDLVSAHTGLYLVECIKSIVFFFKPKSVGNTFQHQNIIELTAEEMRIEEIKFTRVHQLLQGIIHIVPSAKYHIQNILGQCYPHYQLAGSYMQECYANNLLKLTEYLPIMRSHVFHLIIKQMIEFDSQASRDVIQMMEDNDENLDDQLCMFENNEPLLQMKLREAHILDCLMNILFNYIQKTCHPNGQLDWNITKKLYFDMINNFEDLLLPTFTTCHVQFVFFYLFSFRIELSEAFIDLLWKKIESPNIETIYRQAASSYLGSYLSRANYISTSLIKNNLLRIKDWIHRYIENSNYFTDSHMDLIHHGPFYFVCQAFFYVIVFRHREIIDENRGQKFFLGLQLQKIVSSQLNPLKYCLPAIAKTFCSVIRASQIAVCDTILERNQRKIQLEVINDTDKFNNIEEFIVAFFPFDPYLLLNSNRFIKNLYQEYDNSLAMKKIEENVSIPEEDDYMEYEQDQVVDSSKHFNFVNNFSPAINQFFLHGSSPGFHNI